MRLARAWFVAAIGALAVECSSGPPPPFSVQGGFLRDADGRAVILHGANVSGHHKWSPYFDFHQPADFARMRDEWGMNSMRLLTTWAAIEPQRGVFDEAYLSALEQRVEWAEAAGILVVVDMHQDLYGEGFLGGDGAPLWTCDASRYAAFVPTTPWFFGNLDPNVEACVDGLYHDDGLQTEFTEAWKHVAAKLASHANVVGFDPLNEPGWGTAAMNGYEAEVLAPFYERVVAAVRSVAPQWVAFIEPGSSRNLGLPTGLPKPDYPNVVYAPHAYDSDAEQGKPFDAAHRANVLANAAALRTEADALGAALWIGEYGGPSSLANITDYITAERDGIDAVGGGATYWDYSKTDDGYGLLNNDGSEKTAILAIVARPYPQRVAGGSVQSTWDGATRTLTVTYAPDRSIAAPTLIAVPPAFQPVSVECGGCAYDLGSPGVRIVTPPPSSSATIVVHTP
ncbi:MAG TPA: cellulase family glycosylhydrolase [Polyangiaceae bacterium]|nr:cellulase family glycosylhydrolase [Polyangiaceae bacterium]